MNNTKIILVTGSTGMLGNSIIQEFIDQKNIIVYGVSRNSNKTNNEKDKHIILDLVNFDLLKQTLEEIRPNIIIHCAAMVNVDECEENTEKAYNLHVKSTEILASYNSKYTKFVYLSTDSVFEGSLGNYNETDNTNPLNYYAHTKLEGEKIALKINPNTIVIRTNIYGFHNPFCNSLVEWAYENLSKDKSINGFTDVYFNPVYVGQLARVIKYLCYESNCNGILNVGSKKYISKYEFLIQLAKEFNFSEKLICKASINDIKFKALRPKNTTLRTAKLMEIYNQVPTLESGLLEMENRYKYELLK